MFLGPNDNVYETQIWFLGKLGGLGVLETIFVQSQISSQTMTKVDSFVKRNWSKQEADDT